MVTRLRVGSVACVARHPTANLAAVGPVQRNASQARLLPTGAFTAALELERLVPTRLVAAGAVGLPFPALALN